MPTTAIVIDDDPDTLEVFCEFLTIKNIDVRGKGQNGLEALELYKKVKPDVVLMDVLMPTHDGIYGLRRIREYDPDSKIILVTASITPDTQQKIHDLNPSAIVCKPFDIDDLLNIIDNVKNGIIKRYDKNNLAFEKGNLQQSSK